MTIRQSALIGFSQFETMTLESFFRLAGRRPPGYAIAANPAEAHVLLINGDDPAAVQALWERYRGTPGILIGSAQHGTDWVAMARPIRLLAVLEMIEKLIPPSMSQPVAAAEVQARADASVANAFSRPPAGVGVAAAAPAVPAVPLPAERAPAPPPAIFTPISAKKPPAQTPAAPSPLPPRTIQPPALAPAPSRARPATSGFGNSKVMEIFQPSMGHEEAKDDDDLILVVDDSDIVLRFMQGRLQRFGYSVALASSGEQAVEMAKVKAYKFVFLDVMMPGIDGYQTCRMIKSAKTGAPAPVVVMLSSRGGSIDKIRGTLAGADAYLTKPLAEAALIKVLADHDSQSATNFSATRPVTGRR